ncbi:MAG TPA: lysis system i-spanin subunit Rz [Pseudorhodoferax sp.]|nr:lysis system i-spanin subunit Rz [Pseudorhodoferax sp.]
MRIPYAREAGAVLLLAALAASHWAAYRQGGATERAAHANTRAAHAQQLQRLADKTAAAATSAQRVQQALQQFVAAIDTQRTQELAHALADNDRRRTADAAGPGRLRIPAVCPGPRAGADLPGAAPAAGVDAPAAEIPAAVRQELWDLRAALITERAQLLALQDYARACSAPSP